MNDEPPPTKVVVFPCAHYTSQYDSSGMIFPSCDATLLAGQPHAFKPGMSEARRVQLQQYFRENAVRTTRRMIRAWHKNCIASVSRAISASSGTTGLTA